jgi:hypothetical protein
MIQTTYFNTLKKTYDLGIFYHHGHTKILTTYIDVDWGGCLEDQEINKRIFTWNGERCKILV